MGKVATSPLPYRGSPPLQSGGQNQKWPTSGRNGYLTPAVSGIPTASERGAKSEVAHKWAKWLPHPCRIGDPHRFRAEAPEDWGPFEFFEDLRKTPFRPRKRKQGHAVEVEDGGLLGFAAFKDLAVSLEEDGQAEVPLDI